MMIVLHTQLHASRGCSNESRCNIMSILFLPMVTVSFYHIKVFIWTLNQSISIVFGEIETVFSSFLVEYKKSRVWQTPYFTLTKSFPWQFSWRHWSNCRFEDNLSLFLVLPVENPCLLCTTSSPDPGSDPAPGPAFSSSSRHPTVDRNSAERLPNKPSSSVCVDFWCNVHCGLPSHAGRVGFTYRGFFSHNVVGFLARF